MASVYAPNVAQFNLNFTYQGEPAQNTMYLLYEVEPNTAALNATAEVIANIWLTEAAPFVPQAVTLNSVEAISLDQAGAPIGGYTPAVPIQGEDIGEPCPNQVTIAVSFRTGYSGRSRRGRNYWVGLLRANVTNNRLDSAVMTAILGYYSQFLPSAGLIEGAIWGVYSRRSNGADRLIGLFTPINQILFVNNIVDSQRDRNP